MERVEIIASRWQSDRRVKCLVDDNQDRTKAKIKEIGRTIEESFYVNSALTAVTNRVKDFQGQEF
jgi:uncharacterized membrane protein